MTIYEPRHPNVDRTIIGVVTHSAPQGQQPLTQEQKIYKSWTMLTGATQGWIGAYTQACDHINNQGANMGFVVASGNDSYSKGQVVMTFSYDSNVYSLLREQLRPSGCCQLF